RRLRPAPTLDEVVPTGTVQLIREMIQLRRRDRPDAEIVEPRRQRLCIDIVPASQLGNDRLLLLAGYLGGGRQALRRGAEVTLAQGEHGLGEGADVAQRQIGLARDEETRLLPDHEVILRTIPRVPGG